MSLRGRIVIGVCLSLFAAFGLYGCTLGYGTDRDGIRVIATAQGILAGHYQRSRSFGFPLHELAAAWLYAAGGIWAVNFGALLAALAGIAMAARLAAPRAVPVVAGLCACPIILVNASSGVDFAWSFAAGMAVLLAAAAGAILPFGIAVLASLLLRPDNILFVAAVCLAAIWRAWRPGLHLCAAAGLAAVVAVAIYAELNGTAVFATGVSTTRPWLARLARANVFGAAALGPGGAMLAVFLPWRRPAPAALPALVAMLAWVFYLPRFIALPDQLDYLILPVAITVLAGLMVVPARWVWPAVALVALPSLATVSLFARGADGALMLRPRLQPGAFVQDAQARRFAARLDSQDLRQFVATALPAEVAAGLRPAVFMPGYTNARGDLILGADHLYAILPAGGGLSRLATVPRGYFSTIWACDAPLGPGIGWRGWEAPAPQTVLLAASKRATLHCARADDGKV